MARENQIDLNQPLSESTIVRRLADQLCIRIARKAIRMLQRQRDTLLSGDDSGLTNAWEEICVQIQRSHSIYWDAYEETVGQHVELEIRGLPPHEMGAIWLQTPNGELWDLEEEDLREPYPVCTEDVVTYILEQYVYREASDWSNQRIRRYIDVG